MQRRYIQQHRPILTLKISQREEVGLAKVRGLGLTDLHLQLVRCQSVHSDQC